MGAIGGAATGAAIGMKGGWVGALVGAAVGGLIGAGIGYISSIDKEELETCKNAENELSQIDEKADLIKNAFLEMLYAPFDMNFIYDMLMNNSYFIKEKLRMALRIKTSHIEGFLNDTLFFYFDKNYWNKYVDDGK